MDIKGLRLLSGEEILGKVTQTDDGVLVNNPCALSFGQNPQKPTLSFVPLLPHAVEDEVEISNTMIVFQYTPMEQLVNKWNEIYGNGLVMPNSDLQL